MKAKAGLASILLLMGLAACGPLNSNELRQEVSGLHSAAAEGALLARGAAEDRTRSTFTRVQAKELSASASASAEKLHDADPAAGLQDERDRAISLAQSIADALDQLAFAPGAESAARQTERQLLDLSTTTRELEDSL